MNDIFIPPLVTGPALRDYFMSHVRIYTGAGVGAGRFFTVTKPLHVFKIACARSDAWNRPKNRIVNLVIPVGALIHVSGGAFGSSSSQNERKMRASEAVVHSIARYTQHSTEFNELGWVLGTDAMPLDFDPKKVKPAAEAFSDHNSSFRYAPGKTVRPTNGFNHTPGACAGGIHFFLNLRDALDY